ncbi:MAG: ABC-F family ATP-binding cassette domain-containing protein [Bacteroidota bacterium]
MIQASNISIHFANRYLFDGISFTVNLKDRIGLIGRNGTGKSTLLKILNGIIKPEEGLITTPKDFRLGYLPQETVTNSEKSIFDETLSALTEMNSIEAEMQEINKQISISSDYDSPSYLRLIQKHTELNERFNHIGGNTVEGEIETILVGLGFKREDFHKPLNEFSGGWQMRVELAKILISKPNCILLDEPTNHLDIESIQWLEEFLKNYDGSIIIVSHDRTFLDAVTIRTMELSHGKMYDFNHPYSKFISLRGEIRQQQIASYKEQQKQIAETERFIERFRYKATLASRVQSRIKQLEKVDRIELEDEDVTKINFRFPEAPRSGRVAAEAIELSKSYGDNLVLNKINFAIERGEKIAFVGRNGEGKSTLSKIIAGLEDYEGTLKIGFNVQTGYYAQHQAELLEGKATVFETVDGAAYGEMRTKVRSLLGAFLFSGETVEKKVQVLSGGEKSRLALALLLLNPVNLLILDEPTNHLDMAAKDVLKNALINYTGALVIVSHDRDFLKGLTDKTFYFKDGTLREYTGDIYDFLEKTKIDALSELEYSDKNSEKTAEQREEENPKQSKLYREQKKNYQREENKFRKAINECELKIEELEKQIQQLENDFSNAELMSDVELTNTRKAKYEELRESLDKRIEEWTELNEELDVFRINSES